MVDGEYIFAIFLFSFFLNFFLVVSLARYYSRKNPVSLPTLLFAQSPYHCVLDSLKTPSTDHLGFLSLCKASLLVLKGKVPMLISRVC